MEPEEPKAKEQPIGKRRKRRFWLDQPIRVYPRVHPADRKIRMMHGSERRFAPGCGIGISRPEPPGVLSRLRSFFSRLRRNASIEHWPVR